MQVIHQWHFLMNRASQFSGILAWKCNKSALESINAIHQSWPDERKQILIKWQKRRRKAYCLQEMQTIFSTIKEDGIWHQTVETVKLYSVVTLCIWEVKMKLANTSNCQWLQISSNYCKYLWWFLHWFKYTVKLVKVSWYNWSIKAKKKSKVL